MVAIGQGLWWVVVKCFCGFLSNDVVTFAQEVVVAIGQRLWWPLVKNIVVACGQKLWWLLAKLCSNNWSGDAVAFDEWLLWLFVKWRGGFW